MGLAGNTYQLGRRCYFVLTQADAIDVTRPLNEPSGAPLMYPTTPDGRYFVVNGKLWRCSNPSLPADARQKLVNALMNARREVKTAKASGDKTQLTRARARVQKAKVELGERGPVWWDDGSPDFNQCQVKNTPYSEWHKSLAATQAR